MKNYVGVLSLRTLVLNTEETQLKDIMFDELITSLPEEPEDEVAADISKYGLLAMPVVDESGPDVRHCHLRRRNGCY